MATTVLIKLVAQNSDVAIIYVTDSTQQSAVYMALATLHQLNYAVFLWLRNPVAVFW